MPRILFIFLLFSTVPCHCLLKVKHMLKCIESGSSTKSRRFAVTYGHYFVLSYFFVDFSIKFIQKLLCSGKSQSCRVIYQLNGDFEATRTASAIHILPEIFSGFLELCTVFQATGFLRPSVSNNFFNFAYTIF